ncbi:serum paraoxonase/arylesterase 1-like [Ptychodera flava]|uniref:serum paraoxonase/arylesterase 1-like n=1 Tax=Ptychodera flava TaxID=63121 RepID=UPI00396A2B0B
MDPSRMLPNLRGRIFLFDFNHPDDSAIEVTLNGDFDRENFFPHGISLYEDQKTAEVRLFVVNHHISDQERIEIFRFDENATSLNHLKTVTGENIHSVNDVLAVGPESFYYTNDWYFVNKFGKMAEMLSGLCWGTVGYYHDGQDAIVARGLRMANGINMSPDGRYLYVAAAFQGQVVVFERQEGGSLEEKQRIDLCLGADNIEIDKRSGDLWLGCQSVLYKLFQHGMNVTNPAASQVLRIRPGSKSAPYASPDIREIFVDDGTLASSSSVASYYDDKLLVGTVLDRLVYCEIKTF